MFAVTVIAAPQHHAVALTSGAAACRMVASIAQLPSRSASVMASRQRTAMIEQKIRPDVIGREWLCPVRPLALATACETV
ncbi:hypothetical protein V1291_005141 [Nitrobacteraceae bacterium AZCC 1564]